MRTNMDKVHMDTVREPARTEEKESRFWFPENRMAYFLTFLA